MPKQNAQSKPPHRPARRKSKPKFDVPAGIGEPSSASWVYRDDVPVIPPDTSVPPPAAVIAETLAAPIAAAIEAVAAVEPEPARNNSPGRPVGTASESPAPRRELSPSPALRLFAAGLGFMEFCASTTLKLVTAPFGIMRRFMPD
jgi:hypothetical protein